MVGIGFGTCTSRCSFHSNQPACFCVDVVTGWCVVVGGLGKFIIFAILRLVLYLLCSCT